MDQIDAIGRANYLCDTLGMDPISAGVTIACTQLLLKYPFCYLSNLIQT
ncbi:MAG: aldehyde ferredoxin oxidoreductase C-terminal domain-containing protein [Candidatus Omnitrophica bacterium]|nr:aldehyde ferredoxin oxidoreductase C-terminal domain-containing protein [Candidatus Omnitrophota bacterium]